MKKILSFSLSILILFSTPLSTFAISQGGPPSSNYIPPTSIIPTTTTSTVTSSVYSDKVWSITFNKQTDSNSAIQNITVLKLVDGQWNQFEIQPIVSGNKVLVNHNIPYSDGKYQLKINKNIKGVTGSTMSDDINLDFTVQTPIPINTITIKSIADINVTTLIGTPPILPNFVDVTMSDGTTQSMKVKWQSLNLILFYRVSVKPVYGTLADFSYSVKANVSVVDHL